jgi:chromosome segregation ATPase
MAFFDMASLGWEIAGCMGIYTITRNWRQDTKAEREKKEKAFSDAVARIASCETRLERGEREVNALAEIVKKYADLHVLVATLSSSVKSLESGLQEVKTTYRDLNRGITEFFRQHRAAQ